MSVLTPKVWDGTQWVGGGSLDAAYRAEVLADTPAGYWPLTTDLDDASGNAQHLTTQTGQLWTPITDGWGTALLGATGDWVCPVRCPQVGYTIEAWALHTGIVNDNAIGGDWGGPGGALGAMIAVSSGTVRAFHRAALLSFGVTTVGVWHHYVTTWDGATHTVYLDGQPVGSRSETTAPLTGSASRVSNYGNRTNGQRWPGLIAHLAWYPVALTAGRVAAHYAAAPVT